MPSKNFLLCGLIGKLEPLYVTHERNSNRLAVVKLNAEERTGLWFIHCPALSKTLKYSLCSIRRAKAARDMFEYFAKVTILRGRSLSVVSYKTRVD